MRAAVRRCPRRRTGDSVKGCINGYGHAGVAGRTTFPLRVGGKSALERSLRYVLSGKQTPARWAVRCKSLRECVITSTDPLSPASTLRGAYAITGEQVKGCWTAALRTVLKRGTEDSATWMPPELVGCVSWSR